MYKEQDNKHIVAIKSTDEIPPKIKEKIKSIYGDYPIKISNGN